MALVERTEKTTDATNWQSGIPLSYRYTAGRAGQKFLSHVKEKGEFLASNCSECGVTYVPPTIYCERCLARIEDSFAPMPARGTVHAFTICHEAYDGTRKDEPSIVALIRVDGTDGGFLHWLGEIDVAAVEIGMKVEAVMKPKGQRTGSVLDIKHFKPVR